MRERVTRPGITRRQFAAGSIVAGTTLVLPRFGPLALAHQADLASAGYPAIDIMVTATAFEGIPDTIEAGRYLINATIDASLTEGGGVAFLQPFEMTADEFFGFLGGPPEESGGASPEAAPEGGEGEEEGPLPSFVYQSTFAGGAYGMGGATASAVIDLTEGEWIAWGDDPEAPQMPVVFNVTGEFPADAAEPEADVMVTFIDFGIMVEGALTAGDHIFRVENLGAQPHFLVLLMIPDGVTNDDIAALLESEISGTPAALPFNPDTDFQDVGFTPTQSIGTVNWHPMTLEAGNYAGLCFFPTAGIGDPHAYHGMHTVFEVTA